MDDYSALAQRISVSVGGVSGAMILSRDGLVLGAFPDEYENLAKPAWLRFIALGEPDRSFVEFPDQVWAFVKRGPYAAFVIAEPGTRPGILVDQMEQVLLIAEEGRSRRDPMRVPEASAAPSGKPRTSLHPQGGKPVPGDADQMAEVAQVAEDAPRVPERPAAAEGSPSDRGGFSRNPGAPSGEASTAPLTAAEVSAAPTEPLVEIDEQTPPAVEQEPPDLGGSGAGERSGDESEVDPVLLAKEFSGLLQVDSDDDEGTS